MKLGLGLYRHMLDDDHFRFARQCGCTHIVAHLVDYTNALKGSASQPGAHTDRRGQIWGRAGNGEIWSYEELSKLKSRINAAGLELAALENFDPAQWHDVLLDGPKKAQQLENLKNLIRNVGKAGIPCFGYNFSLAGVAGRVNGNFARGDAESIGMDGVDESPIPRGTIWNMAYDANPGPETIPTATHEQLWKRLKDFLDALLPVAEEAKVILAAHPDDPPVPMLRQQPRLVYQPHMYQRLLDLHPSPANKLEFCIGSLAEMTEGDIYSVVDQYSSQKRLGYVHFRNIRGKVPTYKEMFVDDGDVDMIRALRILKKNGFDGVLIPDHTPQMSCGAPWHAGMAFALGYMRAALQCI